MKKSKRWMWCLINIKTEKPIKIFVTSGADSENSGDYAVGFATRKGLLSLCGEPKSNEKILKVEF